ncbi:hypothetical protein YC2023_003148 [Brassica napus]
MGGRRFVTPRQTCPRPEGLGRNLRSKTRWFTGFCNSHQVSHFATFFIDARAEISVAESRFRLYIAALLPNKHRLRVGESRLFSCIFLDTFRTVRNRPTESDVSSFSDRSVSRTANHPRRRDPNTSPDHSIGRSDGRGVLKATSADPWSASFMVETRTLFVFHKSKNFTSDYEIRMPPTACFEHSNFFKVTAPEARPGQLRPGAYRRQKRQADRCSPKADRATHPKYTRTSVCVRQHTQDVCGRPSAHTGRPAVHQYTYQHAPWTVRVILAHVGCLFSTHRTSVSTRRTSVAVRVCPCVRQCTQDVRQHTQDVRQHTQDVRGCPCVSVCPSVHTGRPSAHTGRPSAHAGRPSAHAGRPWLSVCVRVSVSAHRTSVSTHRTSVSTRRTSVAVRVCPCVRQHTQDVRQHTQDVRQHTQDVRAYPLAHTDCPWTDPCTELISAC